MWWGPIRPDNLAYQSWMSYWKHFCVRNEINKIPHTSREVGWHVWCWHSCVIFFCSRPSWVPPIITVVLLINGKVAGSGNVPGWLSEDLFVSLVIRACRSYGFFCGVGMQSSRFEQACLSGAKNLQSFFLRKLQSWWIRLVSVASYVGIFVKMVELSTSCRVHKHWFCLIPGQKD